MATISRHLADVVSRRHGIVTHDELVADSQSRHGVRRLVEAGLLVVEHKQVYRLATSPDTTAHRSPAVWCCDVRT